MEGEDERRGYASPPCMMHEAEVTENDVLHLYYLYIDERRGGFGWQVRAYERDEPIEIGRHTFPNERDAQDAGRAALDRICAHIRRHGALS